MPYIDDLGHLCDSKNIFMTINCLFLNGIFHNNDLKKINSKKKCHSSHFSFDVMARICFVIGTHFYFIRFRAPLFQKVFLSVRYFI